MKRIISLTVALFMLSCLFAGCGQNAGTAVVATTQEAKTEEQTKAPEETTKEENKIIGKISFATNRTDKVDTVFKEIADEFKAKYPGTEVEIEGIKDPESILKTRMAANELPDVTLVLGQITNNDLPLYFAPIDDLGFTKDSIYYYDQGLGPDGKLYKVNSTVGYDGMVYNKNVFRECGIEKLPTTLDEFYGVCEKIKAKGIVPAASNFKDKWPLWWYVETLPKMTSGNPNFCNELASKDAFLSDDGGVLAAMDLLRTMQEKGYLEKDLMSTNWDGMKKEMATGKIAMAFLGTWFPAQLIDNGAKQEDIGMFPFPGSKALIIASDWNYAVSKNSKNLDTAKAFLKFAFEDGKIAVKCGQLSPLKGVKYSDEFINELTSFNLPILEAVAKTEDYQAINAKMQIEWPDIAQEYMLSKKPDDVVKKYNEKWAETRKAVTSK